MDNFYEERLLESFECIYKNAGEGILVVDANGRILRTTPSFDKLLDYEKGELKGRLFTELIHKEEKVQRITSKIGIHHFQRSSDLPMEMELTNKGGDVVPVKLRSVFIKDNKGMTLKAIGIIEYSKEEKLEHKMLETQEALQNILSNSGDAIMVADANGRINIVNEALLQMLGYQRDEIIGRHLIELSPHEGNFTTTNGEKVSITGEYINYQVEKGNQLFEKGKVTNYELYLTRKDGKIAPIEATISILKYEQGERRGSISICRDITERKKVEKEIRESRDFLEKIIESSEDGIVINDENGYIIFLNTALEKMCKYKKEELIGKHVSILSSEDKALREKTLVKIEELFERGLTSYETKNKTKEGEIIDVECSSSMNKDDKGNYIAGVSIIRNITERKKMEESLRKRVKELSVLNSVSEVLSGSLELNVILNKTLQKILDITGLDCGAILLLNEKGDRLVLKASMGFKSGVLKEGVKLALDTGVSSTTVKSKEPVIIEEMEKCDMPGIEILIEEKIKNFVSIPLVSRDKVNGAVNVGSHVQHYYSPEELNLLSLIANQIGLAIDNAKLFEETRNALKDLKQTQSYLLQSEKMASIGQLAAGIAHEINNPTGFVHSNLGSLNKYSNKVLELLKRYEEGLAALKDNGSEEIASFYAEMDELKKRLKIDFIINDFQKVIAESLGGTERIKKIVADLKSFSRVDQAEFKYDDINEGLKSTLNVVWNELKYKCTVEKDFGDLPQIYCNMGQINQVFMNILVNAAQAIEQKGAITISTRYVNGQSAGSGTEQDYIEIKISDAGRGIPEDKLNRIFEPFFTTKPVGKGTGLGLSIAYDIIQKHKGEIKVDSEVGKGTTFTIQLPKLEEEQRA